MDKNSISVDPVESLIECITSYVAMDYGAKTYIRDHVLVERFPKRAIIQHFAQVSDRIYFVHSGLTRTYYIDKNGNDISSGFYKEFDFVFSPYNFLNSDLSEEAVEILEKSTLISLKHEYVDRFYGMYPQTVKLGFLLHRHYSIINDERLRVMRELTNEELYLWFLDRHPDLYGRVPYNMLASFLGMAKETMSRLQKRKVKSKN